jgi:hypothetical protein
MSSKDTGGLHINNIPSPPRQTAKEVQDLGVVGPGEIPSSVSYHYQSVDACTDLDRLKMYTKGVLDTAEYLCAESSRLTAERDALKAENEKLHTAILRSPGEIWWLNVADEERKRADVLKDKIERARSLFTLDNEGHVTKISLALADEVLATLADDVVPLQNDNSGQSDEQGENQ